MKTSIRLRALAATVVALALTLAGCGQSYNEPTGPAPAPSGPVELTVMIGSSGEAETRAVQAATQRYADKTGNKVRVIPAQDLTQQLQQGFAGGNPPDAFYVGPSRIKLYADGGSLFPYGDQLPDADDFYPSLKTAFSVDGKFYCAPKDAGNLALVIDTEAWAEAGLTDADYPKDWDQLAAVAEKLTTDKRAGFVVGRDYITVGEFMLGNGGFFLNDEETAVTTNTPENLAALKYLQTNLDKGSFAYPQDVETTWGGEALGLGKAAMALQGSWVVGALDNDFPDRKWKAVEMPAGPAGNRGMAFTNCWGIAEKSKHKEAAVELVKHLVSPEEMKASGEAFGPQPSRRSLAEWNATTFPEKAPFATRLENGRAEIGLPGYQSVLDDFGTQLELLNTGKVTPEKVLERAQKNGEAALKDR